MTKFSSLLLAVTLAFAGLFSASEASACINPPLVLGQGPQGGAPCWGQQPNVRIPVGIPAGQPFLVNTGGGNRYCTWMDRGATALLYGGAGALGGFGLGKLFKKDSAEDWAKGGLAIGAAAGATVFCDPNLVNDGPTALSGAGNVVIQQGSGGAVQQGGGGVVVQQGTPQNHTLCSVGGQVFEERFAGECKQKATEMLLAANQQRPQQPQIPKNACVRGGNTYQCNAVEVPWFRLDGSITCRPANSGLPGESLCSGIQ